MRTSDRSVFHHWSRSVSVTDRTAVYGPVCTVVWQGSAGNRGPYADQPPRLGRRPPQEPLPQRRISSSGSFTAAGPDRLWVADITYVPTWAGFLFLAVVLEAWSRRIVGWAMDTHLRTDLVLAALDMALTQRRPTAVIHHSDQGCQYTSLAFGGRCREAGVRPSMGSVGDAYDNAMCESFFATLECELLDREPFRTHGAARLAVFDFIEGWYNPRRRHSSLDYLSPMIFERSHRTDDRTVPSGSTMDPGGAISAPPSVLVP